MHPAALRWRPLSIVKTRVAVSIDGPPALWGRHVPDLRPTARHATAEGVRRGDAPDFAAHLRALGVAPAGDDLLGPDLPLRRLSLPELKVPHARASG